MSRTRGSTFMAALSFSALTLVAACDDSDFPTTPGRPDDGLEAMAQAIQSEFFAENTYLRVLADFGRVLPFQDIMYAQQRHSEAIAYLFVARGLEVPLSEWDINNVPVFQSVQAACLAAVRGEQDIVALYDELLRLSLPPDIDQVFTANRNTSLNNRLPSFESCD